MSDCVSPHKDVFEDQRVMMGKATDANLLAWLEWNEFKQPIRELNVTWRQFCRVTRHEARKRGLKV